MKKFLARIVRQSPAMVVAMLALFVSLTGTAVATTSVLITGKQIRNGSITGLDVKKKTLTAKHFKGSVRGARGATGPAGAQGATGAPGAKGETGAQGVPGLSGLEQVSSVSAANSQTYKSHSVNCPTGKKALGGGFDLDIQETGYFHNIPPVFGVDSNPIGGTATTPPTGWRVYAREDNSWSSDTLSNDWTITVWVLCANVA
jgi:hypothetical protein